MTTMSSSAGITGLELPGNRPERRRRRSGQENLDLSSVPCNSSIIPSSLASRQSRIYGAEIVQAAAVFRILGSDRRL